MIKKVNIIQIKKKVTDLSKQNEDFKSILNQKLRKLKN